MKKNNFFALLTLVGFLLPAGAMALPQMSKVESGSVNAVEVGSSMIIEASDNAIVDYNSFGIAENEKVQFIQPNAHSVILNRIIGEDASDILGSLNSNGKVFLVNPNGVYFGPNAKVDVGSLISSTLDIANENFIAGNYKFINGGGEGTIINLGSLSAPEGAIALISPDIQNEGIISAKAGKVVLATGENVTVDFYGDSLMNFTVDNTIYAKETSKIKMTADKAAGIILDVVNNDNISEGTKFVKKDGIIRIVEDSAIEAEEVVICGKENSTIVVNGTIDASSYYGDSIGGKIEIYGEKITVDNAKILAYGDAKGGEIYIGGNWYGENSVFNAKETILKENSIVSANSLFNGDGGKVCVWSDNSTTFNGILSARGGQFSGSGGFVETSSGGFVGSLDSFVDTYSVSGDTGTWSIDPAHIIIGSRGVDSLESAEEANDTLSLRMLNSAVFRKATSNIVLRALSEAGTVTIDDGSSISIPEGYGISFDVDPNYGVIFLKTGAYVETAGGDIIFNGPVMLEGDSCLVKTNANGATGGDVIFNYAINGQGLSDFAIDAGKGKVVFAEEVGKRVPVGAININAGKIDLYASMNTKGRSVTLNAPMNFFDDLSIDTAVNSRTGADVTFNEDINGSYNLVVNASDSIFAHNANIGNKIPLKSLKVKAADTKTSGNVSTYGGTQIYASPITLTGTTAHIDTGPDGIFYLDTITGGSNQYTGTANAGTIVYGGNITAIATAFASTARHVKVQGSMSSFSADATIALTASETLAVAASLTALGTGTITLTGNESISISADRTQTTTLSTATGALSINNPITPSGSVTITSTSGAITLAGANGGNGALTVQTTASSTIAMGTDAYDVSTLTVTALTGNATISAPIKTAGNFTGTASTGDFEINQPAVIGGDFTITASDDGQITVSAPLTTTGAISITGHNGTVTMSDAITAGAGILLANTAGDITVSGDIASTGDVAVNFTTSGTHIQNGDITIVNGDLSFNATGTRNINCNINTNGGNIAWSGAIAQLSGNIFTGSGNFTASNTVALNGTTNLNVGTGIATFTGALSGAQVLNVLGDNAGTCTFSSTIASLTGLTVSIGSITLGSTVTTAGGIDLYANAISVNTATITDTAGAVNFNGPVVLGANLTVTTSNAGTDIFFLSTINSDGTMRDLSLQAGAAVGTGGIVTLGGDVGVTRYIGDFDVTAQALVIGGNIWSNKDSGTLSFVTPIRLIGNSTIYIANAGANLSVGSAASAIDGSYDLSLIVLNTGATAVTLDCVAGANAPLGRLQVKTGSGGTIVSKGNMTTSNGQIYYNKFKMTKAVAGSLTYTDYGEGITFADTLNGTAVANDSLVCNAINGTVTFGNTVGDDTPASTMGALTVTAKNILQQSTVALGTNYAFSYTGRDSVIIAGSVTLLGSGAFAVTSAGAEGIELSGDITVATGNIDFNSPLATTGTRTLTSTTGNFVFDGSVAASGTFAISSTSGDVTMNGMTGYTGAVSLNTTGASTFQTQAIEVDSFDGSELETGNINVNCPIHTIGDLKLGKDGTNQAITFGSGYDLSTRGGNIDLNAGASAIVATNVDMSTQSGSVTITTSDATGFSYGGTINTGDGDLNFISHPAVTLTADTVFNLGSGSCDANDPGTVNGAFSLKVIGNDAGVMRFNGIMGGSTPLTDLVMEIGKINFQAAVTVAGEISLVSNDITFNGDVTTTGGAHHITVTGPVLLTAATTITTAATSDVKFLTSGSTINGGVALTITVGAATDVVRLEGELGGINALTSFTCGQGVLLLGNNIATTAAIAINATGGSVTLIGNSQLLSNTAGNITLSSTVDGFYDLSIVAVDGDIICGGNIGSTVALRSFIPNTPTNHTTSLTNVTTRY